MKKIAVTGTKGKTTVVNILAAVLQQTGLEVLKVDTTGHYINGVQKSTLEDSKAIWGLVPTVAPGRYLWEFYVNKDIDQQKAVAVLETAVGASSYPGLAYRSHDVGIFLNVFEDHLGSSSRLKTREDIARAKQFIFSRLSSNGYAVFNADDALVCGSLTALPAKSKSMLIPCGLKFEHFDLKKHLLGGGLAVSVDKDQVVVLRGDNKEPLLNLKDVSWTFDGRFEPSVINLLHVVGGLLGYFEGQLPKGIDRTICEVKLDVYGGRLTLLKAQNGATILADYAHEKQSLLKVADLAHKLVSKNGKVIGVVRLAYDRTDQLIEETGQLIAPAFDSFIVYDKIDGHLRKADPNVVKFPQAVGRVSKILAEAIKSKNPQVERIIREDQAIQRAAQLAGPNDVVVCIVNDNIKQSLGFIKSYFKAEFV